MAVTYVICAENIRQNIRAHELTRCKDEREANRKVKRYRAEYGRGWSIWWKKA